MMKEKIISELKKSAELKLHNADALAETIEKIALKLTDCLASGGTIYLMGNGGSAADAQHIAGEIVGRFAKERKGMPTPKDNPASISSEFPTLNPSLRLRYPILRAAS